MKNLNETNFNAIVNASLASHVSITATANKAAGDTELFNAYLVNAQSMGYSLPADGPERLIKAFMNTVAVFLSKVKVAKTDQACALVLTDVAGNHKFSGMIEYHDNEENPEEPGNWSFIITFNEEDVNSAESNKTVKKFSCSDDSFKNVFDKVCYDVAGLQFERSDFMYDACCLVIDSLIQVLDAEAVAGQTVDIEMPGAFVASVAVEGDEKVFAITPDGTLKALVKSDIDLEK